MSMNSKATRRAKHQRTLAEHTLDLLDRIRKIIAAEVAAERAHGPDFESGFGITGNPHLYDNLHRTYLRLNGGNLVDGDPEYAARLPEIDAMVKAVTQEWDGETPASPAEAR